MDSHFNSYKVKYDILNQFMKPISNSQIIQTMNVFINLDDLFHNMHNPLINNEFQVCGQDAPKQFISNVFNLLAHYRYYCIKNHWKCKVYGIYTSTIRSFKNNIYTINYRDKFKKMYADENANYYFVNNAIKSSYSLMTIISKYIPDVYLIDSKYLEPSIVPLFISNTSDSNCWNVLISRDTYDLQYSYRNRWSMITPKGDYSRIINQNGIWDYVNFKERVYSEPDVILQYPYSLYILARAIVGDTYRSIPRLRKIGWKTLFKYINQVLDENPGASDITLKIKLIEKVKGKSSLTNEDINCNLNSINIDLQIEAMMELDKALILNQIIDVPDYDNLQELNKIHFLKYPLNIQFLCNTNLVSEVKSPFD